MSEELKSFAPVTAQVTAITPIPVGTVITYSGNDIPNGWLLCNGQAINSNDYPRLTALVGNAVPDLRSRFIVGAGAGSGLSFYGLGSTGGEEKHHLTVDEMPAHSHTLNMGPGWQVPHQGSDHNVMSPWEGSYSTYNAGNDVPHENRPPYYALAYLIKY